MKKKIKWQKGSPKNIIRTPANFETGQTVTTSNDAYLREEGTLLNRNNAPIKAVLPKNTKLTLLEAEYSHAKAGGWFVWIKVSDVKK